MLERLWLYMRAEPWRTASLALAVALVISLGFNIAGGEPEQPEALGPSTTTTTTTLSGSTTTPGVTTTASPGTTVPPVRKGGALVGVRVDNAPGARPQVGIGQAPILIEYPVEGGITRFTAVFSRETSGVVGPIRSLRPVDADLLPAIAPIVVSSGGRPFVLQDVAAAGVNSIVAGDSSMFLSLGRSDPHDTFVDMELVGSILDDSLLPVGGGLPSGGPLPSMRSAANEVDSPMGDTSFVYEQGSGYVRFEAGDVFEVLDLTGQNTMRLSHDTLVFLFAAERPAGYADSNGAPVSTFDVIGSGDLLVFHQGEALTGTWSRSAQQDPFVFLDDVGEPFGLPRGRTYFAVIPRGGEGVTFD